MRLFQLCVFRLVGVDLSLRYFAILDCIHNRGELWTEENRFFVYVLTLFNKVTSIANASPFFDACDLHYFDLRSIPSLESRLQQNYGDSNPIVFWCLDSLTGE